eukprot:1500426-Pyramimonas_sp.AAC.1
MEAKARATDYYGAVLGNLEIWRGAFEWQYQVTMVHYTVHGPLYPSMVHYTVHGPLYPSMVRQLVGMVANTGRVPTV